MLAFILDIVCTSFLIVHQSHNTELVKTNLQTDELTTYYCSVAAKLPKKSYLDSVFQQSTFFLVPTHIEKVKEVFSKIKSKSIFHSLSFPYIQVVILKSSQNLDQFRYFMNSWRLLMSFLAKFNIFYPSVRTSMFKKHTGFLRVIE